MFVCMRFRLGWRLILPVAVKLNTSVCPLNLPGDRLASMGSAASAAMEQQRRQYVVTEGDIQRC
ncbi:hypothetical protein OK016_17505 [Vibrio chagasii]|nr:hypothetical protein [Vibrio chagasii]